MGEQILTPGTHLTLALNRECFCYTSTSITLPLCLLYLLHQRGSFSLESLQLFHLFHCHLWIATTENSFLTTNRSVHETLD